jgi:triosephosphate isomerase
MTRDNHSCIVFTNWKMNKTLDESRLFFDGLIARYGSRTDLDLIMCIPSLYIGFVSPLCTDACVSVGAENMYVGEWGAYTGELSAPMLRSTGCTHVLIGHSERRKYFHEDDELVNAKLLSALKHGLMPIVCIGETREERDGGNTFDVLERQVRVCLNGVQRGHELHVAYEPRWAIGTGVTPAYDEIQESHLFIRNSIDTIHGRNISRNIRLLYGGSVSTDNACDICSLDGVDGVGFGGCSLDLDCLIRGVDESLRAFQASSSK